MFLIFDVNRRLKEESHSPSGRNLLSKAKTSIPLNPRMFTGLWFANGYSPTSWVIYIFSFNQHVPEASSVSGFHSCKRTRHDRKNFSEQMSFRQILITQRKASLNHLILNFDILTIKWGISSISSESNKSLLTHKHVYCRSLAFTYTFTTATAAVWWVQWLVLKRFLNISVLQSPVSWVTDEHPG